MIGLTLDNVTPGRADGDLGLLKYLGCCWYVPIYLHICLFRVCRQLKKCTCNWEKRSESKELFWNTSLRHSKALLVVSCLSCVLQVRNIDSYWDSLVKFIRSKTTMKQSCYFLPFLVCFVMMFLRSGSSEDVPHSEGEWVHLILGFKVY